MDSWKRFRYSGKRRTQHQTQNAERSVESNALVAISPEKRLVRRESFAGPVARHHNRLMILLLRIDQAQFPNIGICITGIHGCAESKQAE
jgi:hypothetical protein